MSKSTLTTKQIKAKLLAMHYSFDDGSLDYDLLHGGYIASDAEGTELAPFVESAKVALENLLNKFENMCEQYEISDLSDDEVDVLMVDTDKE